MHLTISPSVPGLKHTAMPSATGAKTSRPQHDDLDNYDAGDFSDDPFRSPSPAANKRKEPPKSGLGIDEEVSVQKRARVPNIKLDEDRLLGPSGIPKLRARASSSLHLKGKGHEFGDAARLLSFYQLWLDDMFPKARFLDALAMVEKAGHKKKLVVARQEWIDEGKRRSRGADDEEEEDLELRPISTVEAPRQETPAAQDQDVPDDDDLYGATPRKATAPAAPAINNDVPDADDLDGLIAEVEGRDVQRSDKINTPQDEPDDLDALMAEAESADAKANGTDKAAAEKEPTTNFEEEEAAMQEMDGLW